jgi:hypothetical protein
MRRMNDLRKQVNRLKKAVEERTAEGMIAIKVMMIGKRKLTPGLFKQVQIEHIIDSQTNTLLGHPLARVEYHVGCTWLGKPARPGSHHIHVLWLKDGELRHAIELLGSNTKDIYPYTELVQLEQVFI